MISINEVALQLAQLRLRLLTKLTWLNTETVYLTWMGDCSQIKHLSM